MSEDFHGIAIYRNEGYGCLNGIWTNSGCVGLQMNECLRKVDIEVDIEKDSNDICGKYYMAYIDDSANIVSGTVNINKDGSTYIFEWFRNDENTPMFKGIGLQIDKKRYSVSYIKAK